MFKKQKMKDDFPEIEIAKKEAEKNIGRLQDSKFAPVLHNIVKQLIYAELLPQQQDFPNHNSDDVKLQVLKTTIMIVAKLISKILHQVVVPLGSIPPTRY